MTDAKSEAIGLAEQALEIQKAARALVKGEGRAALEVLKRPSPVNRA